MAKNKTKKAPVLRIWVDNEGPTKQQLEKMTKEYQDEIRKTSIWADLVRENGVEKAEEILKEFQVKLM